MGKKKNSKTNPSNLTNSDTEQADQASISTCDSLVTLVTTPPPNSLSAAVEYLQQQFTKMAKTLQYLTDKVIDLDTKLKSSTVTPNSLETMEATIREISATQQLIVTNQIP